MNLFAEYAPSERGADRPAPADGLVIRPAREADLSEIARISRERDGGALEEHLESMRRALERAERSDRSLLLAASQEGRIVGFGRAGHHLPPADSPPDAAPSGWYLLGVIVAPEFRRRGMAFELTRARLAWTAPRCETAYYFVNARNRASIDLHARFGFVERTRRFSFPGVAFQGGVGVLFEKRFMREGPKP